MARVFSPAEERLFYTTTEALQRRLAEDATGDSALAQVRRAFAGFDQAYASAPAKARARVACRAGCDTCCHERVAVQAHEVLIVAQHVQATFAPSELEALIARCAEHRRQFESRDVESTEPPRTPCVLLREGNCSVYEARPEACRAHHSFDAEACRANLAAGAEVHDVKVDGVRGRMFAVMLGIDSAVEAEGYDERAYDFGAALHAALTDSLCAVRWQRREPAFPDSYLETPVESGDSA